MPTPKFPGKIMRTIQFGSELIETNNLPNANTWIKHPIKWHNDNQKATSVTWRKIIIHNRMTVNC